MLQIQSRHIADDRRAETADQYHLMGVEGVPPSPPRSGTPSLPKRELFRGSERRQKNARALGTACDLMRVSDPAEALGVGCGRIASVSSVVRHTSLAAR